MRRTDGMGVAVQIVTDDMPLLVESVLALLSRLGVSVGTVIHPVLSARRTADGDLESLADEGGRASGGAAESWMHIELRGPVDDESVEEIDHGLRRVLSDVRQVASDSAEMHALQRDLANALDDLAADPPAQYTADQLTETAELLRWLSGGNFTLLGYRRYDFVPDGGADHVRATPVPGSAGSAAHDASVADPLDLPGEVGTAAARCSCSPRARFPPPCTGPSTRTSSASPGSTPTARSSERTVSSVSSR